MVARSGPYVVPQQKTRCDNIKAGKEEGECLEPVLLPFPHREGEQEGTVSAVPAHIVFKGATDKGAEFYSTAIEFARWLSSSEGNCRWSADLYEAPVGTAAMEFCQQNGLLDPSDPNLVFFDKYFDRAAVESPNLSGELLKTIDKVQQDAIFPNYQAAILGSMSAEEAFNNIVTTANQLLQQ
jgi:multiple sugar transport system substrate-binding protein